LRPWRVCRGQLGGVLSLPFALAIVFLLKFPIAPEFGCTGAAFRAIHLAAFK
jgi:hypothetical protein